MTTTPSAYADDVVTARDPDLADRDLGDRNELASATVGDVLRRRVPAEDGQPDRLDSLHVANAPVEHDAGAPSHLQERDHEIAHH